MKTKVILLSNWQRVSLIMVLTLIPVRIKLCLADEPVPSAWAVSSAPAADWVAASISAEGTHLAAAMTHGKIDSASGIFVSHDGGIAWKRSAAPNLAWRFLAGSADGRTLVAAPSVKDGIYLSGDFGETWDKCAVPEGNWSAVGMSDDGRTLLAAGMFKENPAENPAGRIYLSADSGKTWGNALAPDLFWRCVAASADGRTLIAAGEHSSGLNEVYLSPDAGASWRKKGIFESPQLSVDCSADGKRVVLGTLDSLQISTDGGATWGQADLPDGLGYGWKTACSKDGMIIFAVGPGLFRSEDGGVTWEHEMHPSLVLSAIASSADGKRAIAGEESWAIGNFGNVYLRGVALPPTIRTQPESVLVAHGSSAKLKVEGTGTEVKYRWQKDGKLLADEAGKISGSETEALSIQNISEGDGGVYSVVLRNSSGSVTSRSVVLKLSSWLPAEGLAGSAISIAASAGGEKLAAVRVKSLFTAPDRQILTSENGGVSWKLSGAAEKNWQVVVCSADGLRLAAAAGKSGEAPGEIDVSEDGGITWKKTSAPNEPWKVMAASANGQTLIALAEDTEGGGSSFYRSADFWNTWGGMPNPGAELRIPDGWQTVACSADGKTIAVANRLIFVSADGGRTWRQGNAPWGYWTSAACSSDGKTMIAAAWWESPGGLPDRSNPPSVQSRPRRGLAPRTTSKTKSPR